MHIGIDASRAARPQRTGTEGYSLHLIQALLALDQRNEYALYFNTAPAPGLFVEGPRCRHRVMPFPRLWTHLRLSAEMAAHPPDLLLVPAHVLPLIHPRRSIVTIHDLGYLHEPHAHRPLDRLYLDLSNRYHVREAARLLAISQATKDDLVRHYGVAPERVAVTYLAAGDEMRPVEDPARVAEVKSRYGISGDYLLYVGTLQPRKNLARLVQAFAPVAVQWPGLRLVLAGKKGWLFEELVAQVRRLGLEAGSLPWLRRSRGPAGSLHRRAGLRLPQPLRGIRHARAGGHGLRRAGGSLQHLQPAGGGRRRRPAGGTH
jgi:glycosyltransferase involved in cell wall biosynthesis